MLLFVSNRKKADVFNFLSYNSKMFLIFLFIIISQNPIFSAVNIYKWEDCIDLTLKNNLMLKKTSLAVEEALYQEKSYRSSFLPKVNAEFDYANNESSRYSGSLNVSQDLFKGFYNYSSIQTASINTEISKLNYIISKAELSYNLKTVYEELLYSKDYLNLINEILKRRQENLKMVELRFESGRENKGVSLLSKAYFEQSKYEQIQAENLIKISKERLAKIMEIDIDTDFEINEPVPRLAEIFFNNLETESLSKEFPEYKVVVLQESLSDTNITLKGSSFYPTLSLRGSLYKNDGYFLPQGSEWVMALSLKVPLFSGGYDFYNLKSAYIMLDQAKIDTKNTYDNLRTKFNTLINSYKENIQKFKSDELFLEASNVRAKISRSKYENGLMDFEDWDDIENELIQRQKEFLKSKKDCIFSEANIEKILGEGVIK